jgi:hypothetical protein
MKLTLVSLCFAALSVSFATAGEAQAGSTACVRKSEWSTADSTKTVAAEPRLIGPNLLRNLPPPDGTAGTVRIRFLVGAKGRVAPWTVGVSGTTDRHWMIRARLWVARAKFRPVVRRRCEVPQWMDLQYPPHS